MLTRKQAREWLWEMVLNKMIAREAPTTIVVSDEGEMRVYAQGEWHRPEWDPYAPPPRITFDELFEVPPHLRKRS
jgi:hypothetical protein